MFGFGRKQLTEAQLEWLILRAGWYGRALMESENRPVRGAELTAAVKQIARQGGFKLTKTDLRTATAGAMSLVVDGHFIAKIVKSGWIAAHPWQPLPAEQRRELERVLEAVVADFQRSEFGRS